MTTTDNNLALLQDLYLCVSATRPKNMEQLLDFLEDQMAIEEDVMCDPEAKYMDTFLKKTIDIDDLHDPEFKMRSHLNG